MTIDQPARPGRRERATDLSFVGPGEHLYALHRDEGERRRVTGAFVRYGLAAGDRVVGIAAGDAARARDVLQADVPVTDGAVRSGQLVLVDLDDVCRSYDIARDLAALGTALGDGARRTAAEGSPGLRVAAEMDGFAAALGSLDALLRRERTASAHQAEAGTTALCQYECRRLPDASAALIAPERTVVDPTAAVTRWPRCHLDCSDRTFLEVGSLRSLHQLAAGLPDDGGIVLSRPTGVVARPTGVVARLLALCPCGGGPVEVEG